MSTADLDIDAIFDMAVSVGHAWMERGHCHDFGSPTRSHPNPWFAVNNETYGEHDEIKGSELVKYALLCCGVCEGQYDCARFAVETGSAGVIASMRSRQMAWLQKQSDWREIIDIAETISMPIQQAVVTVRNGRKLSA